MTAAPLEDLLAEFWARREAGEDLTPSRFVGEHPEHALELRPALTAMLSAASLLPAAELPERIGGYRVQGRLGRGAAGEVFAVVDAHGRPLALKRLLPGVGEVVRSQRRLQREAAVLRALRHPGIVEIVDVGEDEAAGGAVFVVMERVDGGSLADAVRAERAGGPGGFAALAGPGDRWQRIARCVARLAAAVAAAHEVSVLHRDLKPGNVLLRADGSPVLVDFGLAADAGAATLTGTGDVLGTPHYMAPEQARGEVATAASDVYGLGAILYELLTLQAPRQGDPLQVLERARRASPPPPRAVTPRVPRELDLVVRRAMAFRPRLRHADATELARALHLVAEGGRPIGLTLGMPQRLDELWRRRKGTFAAVAGGVAVTWAVVAVLGMQRAAAAQRLRVATTTAAECHLDGDRQGLERAAATVADEGRPALAAWMLGADPGATAEPFVRELAAGHRVLASDPGAARRAFARALRADPQSPIAAAWLGIAAAAEREFAAAERELSAAVRGLPDSVRLRCEYARALRKQARLDAALAQLQYAVTLPRADDDTWHELAKLLHYRGDDAAALAAVETAVARRGEPSLSMLRTKAVVFAGLDRHDEAARILADIVRLDPAPDTWTSYGATLDRLHRLDEAAAAYRAALAIDARHGPALMNLVYLHAGSDRVNCAECRACFAAAPALFDPARAERYAIDALVAQEGDFATLEFVAQSLRRAGSGDRFVAEIDARLREDLPAAALGRLLRARRVLRPD